MIEIIHLLWASKDLTQSRCRDTKSANYHSFFSDIILRDSDNLILFSSSFTFLLFCVSICLSLDVPFNSWLLKIDPKGEIKLLSIRNNQIYKISCHATQNDEEVDDEVPFGRFGRRWRWWREVVLDHEVKESF